MEEFTYSKIGDSVIVKPGTKDPDFSIEIGGWQGRVSDAPFDEEIIGIEWDSETLMNMPSSFIAKCEQQGWGWDQTYLDPKDIEPTTARDSLEDVEKAYQQIQIEHAWDFLGPEAKGVKQVLAGIDPYDQWSMLSKWEHHLSNVLNLPFEAKVIDFQEGCPSMSRENLTVQNLVKGNVKQGLQVMAHRKSRIYQLSLSNLEAIDRASSNYQYLREYVVWFTNRGY
ncbi:calcium-binding protein [Acaryochloris sp. CCMEE 5410]|uniref:calcium-binding protein n=1 Tax=Acaryochloris sp. CCMEE 5410 TaxID=310037 RepID=UPI0002485055|nr:calcium-binding protein [Acaryochloris sp. CCMEE 5410]KAI9129505.1 hypothetical protein ON05_032850 [Acaryochloris sp. CCMEE 5410]